MIWMPIWIPPAERRRFKGLDMAHKTKATMPGRQCSTENKQQDQHTRPVAGGQRSGNAIFSASGTAPTAQLNHNLLISKQSSNLSLVSSKIVGCILSVGGTALQHTQYFPQWGECEPVAGTLILRTSFGGVQIRRLRSPVLGRSNNWYHSFSASLAFLRWRRLISPTAAVIRKPAVLSPLFFTDSISSNTSCGTRTFTCFDLLFTEPVAITESPCVKCYSLYAKKTHNQYLTCYAPSNKVNSTLIDSGYKNGNAPDCSSSTEASNHNVIGANNMADLQHTQTRQEFIRPKHVNHAEKAIAQIVHAKAILALIASQDTNSAAVENALEAVTEMLERAEEELAEVRHA
ncbi:hypothetical protein B6S66_03110 [Citrobacter werkmanii]|nr:hypothetical protein B6S66_03110 [Citrobacter werkmanii]